MNISLRDLKRHVDETAPPPLDVEAIVARGDARLRRRRAALAAGSASLVVLAIVTSVTLTGSDRRSSTPADNPTPTLTDNITPSVARPLTYTDDYAGEPPFWRMRTIQYGDRVLRLGFDVTAIDITDDGLALVAADGGIYVTDGSSTEKIGESTIDYGMTYSASGVKTSTSGSLVAWFTPWGPDRSLVVYDAHEHRVLADVPRPDCVPDECQVATVVGDRVYYWDSDVEGPGLRVLDVPTEKVSKTDARALSEDLRSHPRGFVKGDSYDTGEVVNQDINTEAVFFVPRGSTLELSRVVRDSGADIDGDGEGDGPVIFGYGGFDTTGRPLNLQLPAGYTPAENPYVLFQWLDDDRFAVMAGATHDFGLSGWSGYGDTLVCDIAQQRCTLAVPGPPGGPSGVGFRLVPHLTLPN